MLEQDDMKVSDLMLGEDKRWDGEKIRRLFTQESGEAILQHRVPEDDLPDNIFWLIEQAGEFSVKSAHRTLVAQRCPDSSPLQQGDWRDLWRLNMHYRLKLLLWKVVWAILPTKCKVANRKGVEWLKRKSCYVHSVEMDLSLFITCYCSVLIVVPFGVSPLSNSTLQHSVTTLYVNGSRKFYTRIRTLGYRWSLEEQYFFPAVCSECD